MGISRKLRDQSRNVSERERSGVEAFTICEVPHISNYLKDTYRLINRNVCTQLKIDVALRQT